MFLINGYKQESLAEAIGQRSLVMVVYHRQLFYGKVSLLLVHIQRLQDAC
ncbi:hypothetical protein ACLK1S_06785 [Escherichia coli]